jgi:hypothetical protein
MKVVLSADGDEEGREASHWCAVVVVPTPGHRVGSPGP